MQRINPEIMEHTKQLYSNNLDPDDAEKFTTQIYKGEEAWEPVTEKEVLKRVDQYLKEQSKLSSTK